jgi:hypothetical protein
VRRISRGIMPQRTNSERLSAEDGIAVNSAIQSDQLICEIGNNSLGPDIKPRRHALHKRRDLRNFHVLSTQGGPAMAGT